MYMYVHIGKRQTVLFSATQTRNVDDLARISLKKTPLYVGVDDHRDTATVEGLEQVSEEHIYVYICSIYYAVLISQTRLMLKSKALECYIITEDEII